MPQVLPSEETLFSLVKPCSYHESGALRLKMLRIGRSFFPLSAHTPRAIAFPAPAAG